MDGSRRDGGDTAQSLQDAGDMEGQTGKLAPRLSQKGVRFFRYFDLQRSGRRSIRRKSKVAMRLAGHVVSQASRLARMGATGTAAVRYKACKMQAIRRADWKVRPAAFGGGEGVAEKRFAQKGTAFFVVLVFSAFFAFPSVWI
jgi:hypothetical protein